MKKRGHILKVFGANVRKYRLAKDWTQKDLAFEVDMEPSYLSKMELGKANPSLLKLEEFAQALGCMPVDLLTEGQT
jgi:transcriptional regulator with XRE-family HTH domain